MKQRRVGYWLWAFAIALCCLMFFVSCRQCSYSSNLNRNAIPSPRPSATAVVNENTNASRAPTREDYERAKERYSREARESGRTIGTGENDGWLWVKTRFELAAVEELRDSTINVDVENGVVTLNGRVDTEAQHVRALQTVNTIEGVKGIKDHLIVSTSSPRATPTASPSATPVATPTVEATPNAVFNIDQEVQKFRAGAAITEVPTSMELDETRTVNLVLSPSPVAATAGAAEKEVRADLDRRSAQAPARKLASKTRIETEPVKYSSYMEATLSGQGFEIKPITSERQPVTSNEPTKWIWEIKAKTTGDQYLYLTMNAIFESQGPEKTTQTRAVNTLSKTVTVNVSMGSRIGSFLANNWQWFMAAIVIPLAVWAAPKAWKSIAEKQRKKKRP